MNPVIKVVNSAGRSPNGTGMSEKRLVGETTWHNFDGTTEFISLGLGQPSKPANTSAADLDSWRQPFADAAQYVEIKPSQHVPGLPDALDVMVKGRLVQVFGLGSDPLARRTGRLNATQRALLEIGSLAGSASAPNVP